MDVILQLKQQARGGEYQASKLMILLVACPSSL
jgi:hypothetical protein